MNKHEKEKLEDAKSISKIRTENAVEVAAFPAVDGDIEDIDVIVAKIESLGPAQSSDDTGVAIDKETAKLILAEEIYNHGQLAGSYFMKKGDMTNYRKVNFKFWKLKRLKPTDLKNAAVNMIKICTENLPVLLPYKITTLTIAKLTTDNANYEPLSNKPKEKRIAHKITTTAINDAVKRLTHVINLRLKGSLIAMKEPKPALYYLLYNLTFDDKLGAHSHYPPSVVTGNVIIKAVNSVTGEPVEGVSFRAVGFPQVILTDNFGIGLFVLPIGMQIIKMICFDYLPGEITVEVIEGDQHQDVQMTMGV